LCGILEDKQWKKTTLRYAVTVQDLENKLPVFATNHSLYTVILVFSAGFPSYEHTGHNSQLQRSSSGLKNDTALWSTLYTSETFSGLS
jgi:hypothetical protein